MKELLRLRMKRANMSECLRLLYVAFTRAREKLILISPGNSVSDKNLLANALIADGDGLYRSQIYGASSFESLITATLCRHQDAVAIHSDFCDVLPSDFPVNVEVLNSPPFEEFEVEREAEASVSLDISAEELDRRFSRDESFSVGKIPLKVSVSELSDDEDSEQLYAAELTYK